MKPYSHPLLVSAFGFLIGTSFAPALERISITPEGLSSLGRSNNASISRDGTLIVFDTRNSNIHPDDLSTDTDIIGFNRITQAFELLSRSAAGIDSVGSHEQPVVSAGGDLLLWRTTSTDLTNPASPSTGSPQLALRDLSNDQNEIVSRATNGDIANDSIVNYDITPDGNTIVFQTGANNLDARDSGSLFDIFLRDRNLGTTEAVSISSGGVIGDSNSENPSISGDGRYIFFTSIADNLISADNNFKSDAFLRDRQNNITFRISNGTGMNESNGDTTDGVICGNGEFVFFISDATNLTDDTTGGVAQLFSYHIPTQTTTLISRNSAGEIANDDVFEVDCSDDARFVAFITNAKNFSGELTRFQRDVYILDRNSGKTERVSVRPNGDLAAQNCNKVSISGNGRYVTFETESGNLAPPDLDGFVDILLADNPFLLAEEAAAAQLAAARAAQRASLSNQIKKLKKRVKKARAGGRSTVVKRLKKRLKKINNQLRSL